MDVTSKKRAEDDLKKAQLDFEAIFNNSQVGIMLLRQGRFFARGNQRLAEILAKWAGQGESGAHSEQTAATYSVQQSGKTEKNPNSTSGLINWEQAFQLLDYDRELIQINCRGFTQSSPSNMVKMQKAIQEKNRTELERIAHTLKSALRSLGAQKPAQVVDELEKSAQKSNLDQSKARFNELQELVNKVLAEIEAKGL